VGDRYLPTDAPFELKRVDILDASDQELLDISDEAGLALNLDEMKKIQAHFKGKGRNPTDVELQSLGQAWSEHCCYKSSKVFLREHLLGIAGAKILLRGDAGVIEFDDDHAYALRIESHNHPSQIEPYGGAATGIGGILRDVLCMGAQPVALVDPLHFGPLDYPFEKLPHGVKHPRYLFGGVVAGIRDYGNRVGIPTLAGSVLFDEGYVGNVIINVGCVGVGKKAHIQKNAVRTAKDVFILVGGKTGRDGIHGVTFASVELSEDMEEEWQGGAVQLGDPIMKEPLIHACLEVVERGLIHGMKDLGGGGLSCVVGEMALAGGYGADVSLDDVPMKEEGLAPWEIWVSESQERMMLAVPRENVDEVLRVFDLYDVPATIIGHTIPEKVARVKYRGHVILEMDLDFYTGGPEYCRPFDPPPFEAMKRPEAVPDEPEDYGREILRLLRRPNIASKEWVIRQYDHEVRGATVVKPLQGMIGKACHGDAAVLRPLEDSWRGMAITSASTPMLTRIDPHRGGKSAVDAMCRNLTAVGARPDSFSDCLSWGNPEKPDRLGWFAEAVRGIGEVAAHLELPIPSGNVSFYNESELGVVPPTPALLGVGIVEDVRKCVTSDFKEPGNAVYLLGETKREMGGSEYYAVRGGHSAVVPDVDPRELKASMDALLHTIEAGLVAACHDVSHGGLAIALAEMCIGGDVGARADLSAVEPLRFDFKLFSESNTRWVIEVPEGRTTDFEEAMAGRPLYRLGAVGGDELMVFEGRNRASIPVAEMREAWRSTIPRFMGAVG
jgi:phosphoribosylformylglycinamidine synthase